MKAAVIDTLGTAPRVIAYPDPSPATGSLVLVKVEAAALNAVDLHIASGHHRAGPPQLPYVPAIEAVGTIVAGPDQGLRVRAAAPAGLVPGVNGGMAEFLLTNRATSIPVPEELDSVAAAAIGVVGTSADLSLRKAGIQAGDSVLVLGATGPLGSAAIQLARLAGAKRVIAAGRNPAISARSAWAVGRTGVCRPATLIAHWNGAAWKLMPAPVSARAGWLNDVAVSSARNAWAVGFSGSLNDQRPLILRWNGTAWTRVAGLTGGGLLGGVAATSARNAWAVGDSSGGKTLILHWNGTRWTRVPSPSLAGFNYLEGLAATSARNAWAVDDTIAGKAAILHWNGTRWTRVPSPSLAGVNYLGEVAATSAHNAWAVGATSGLSGGVACAGSSSPADIAGRLITTEPGRLVAAGARTVILHWNGSRWQRETSPSPASKAFLLGVAATSAGTAWAVGATGNPFGATARALVLRWHGHTWQ